MATKHIVSVGTTVGGTVLVSNSMQGSMSSRCEAVKGDSVYVQITSNNGYTFSECTLTESDSNTLNQRDIHISSTGGLFTMGENDVTVNVTFISQGAKFTVSTGYSIGGTVKLGLNNQYVNADSVQAMSTDNVYVKCIPNTGYICNGWSATPNPLLKSSGLKSSGYINVNTATTVTGSFVKVNNWETDGDGYRKYTDESEYTIGKDDSLLIYETITVPTGCVGTVILETSTEHRCDGIFISKNVPQQWDGLFWGEYVQGVSTVNTLYNSTSFATGSDGNDDEYAPHRRTVDNIKSGTYYVAYRRNSSDRGGEGWVRYKFTTKQVWTTDSEGFRRFNNVSGGQTLSYETVIVKSGNSADIILEAAVSENALGIFMVTSEPTGNYNSYRPGDHLYSTMSKDTGNNTAESENTSRITVSGIGPGTYYIVYKGNAQGDWVRYKVTQSGGGQNVSFITSGGKLVNTSSATVFWGDLINQQGGTKAITYASDQYVYIGVAEKTGYVFEGWYDSAAGGTQVWDKTGKSTGASAYWSGNKWNYAGSLTVNARWRAAVYHIIYEGNGSTSGDMDNTVCTYDVQQPLRLNDFKKLNCTFKYWTLNARQKDGDTEYSDGQDVVNLSAVDGSVVRLYAQWEQGDYYDEDRDKGLFNDYNKMSGGSVKSSVNGGVNTAMVYTGKSNPYKIRILDPDSVETLDIFSVTPVAMESNKRIIGSVDIVPKKDSNDFSLRIVNRYSGYYNPIFKDILFYKNYEGADGVCPFSNTAFDEEYKDRQGRFGIINNLWFHKVNEDKSKDIITSLEPYYPLTGQYALDYRDYNIFSSNWDKDYFTRQIDLTHMEKVAGTGSMTEELCMFGSKYLNVPDRIEIEQFLKSDEMEENTDEYWNDEWVTDPSGCPGEVMYKEVNDNSVNFYFFLKKRLVRFFCEKLKPEFSKYINLKYSYGRQDTLDDDIEEYVVKNVLKLYELKKIRVFVKRKKRGVHNSRIENDYSKNLDRPVGELLTDGFTEIRNVSMSKVSTDDFDRKLVYNLRNGEEEEFGFSFVIKKI